LQTAIETFADSAATTTTFRPDRSRRDIARPGLTDSRLARHFSARERVDLVEWFMSPPCRRLEVDTGLR
jgi:hypothetical protein